MRSTVVAGLWLVAACSGKPASKAAAPAMVGNPVKETDLTTVTLTEQAETRLGIILADVERRKVPDIRVLGGEIQVPPGLDVTLTAPRTGIIVPPRGGALPGIGAEVVAGQVLLRFLPLPGEQDQLRSKQEVTDAEARLAVAKTRADRSEALYKVGGETLEALQDARATLATAEAALTGARARYALVTGVASPGTEELMSAPLVAPNAGVLEQLWVSPGQTVVAGTRLLQMASLDSLWVRVPVYVGDLPVLRRVNQVEVRGQSDPAGRPGRTARVVSGPPVADPLISSADLFYALSNRDHSRRPGERVTVTISLPGTGEGLVVPWSAVVHDVHGGTWIYELIKPHQYARRRVELAYVRGDLAILTRGPAPGTKVVTVGAAELFGTEFGVGK